MKKAKNLILSLLYVVALVLTGCNTEQAIETTTELMEEVVPTDNQEDILKTTYPLTITNYAMPEGGGAYTSIEQTFGEAPQRIVANTMGVAELLIQLGLQDRIVGVAALYGEPNPKTKDIFETLPVLSEDYVSNEIVVGASPDIVLGRGDLFDNADWGVGTVEKLNSLGINTFISNTCANGATIESLFKDIQEYGQIFDVADKATQMEVDLRERLGKVKEATSTKETLSFANVAYVEGNTFQVPDSAGDTYQNDALSFLNLENAFLGIDGEQSIESLVDANPDVIIFSIYSDVNEEQYISDLLNNPALQTVSAIQNKRVYGYDFTQFWGYSDGIVDGIEILGARIYPEEFAYLAE